MSLPTQPLRDEHTALYAGVVRLRTLADEIDRRSPAELRHGVEEASRFLADRLIPHAVAEERVLYPAIAMLLRSPIAMAAMSADHDEVARLTRELERFVSSLGDDALDERQLVALRALLYGLAAILTLHFAKEESVYLPVIDEHFSAGEAHALFEEMHESLRAVAH